MWLTERHHQILLALAKESIIHGWRYGKPLAVKLPAYDDELLKLGASFVTLQRYDQLRGCIGKLEATRPLVEDVAENAFAAAFRDPRFPPLSEAERDGLEMDISVLSSPEAIAFASEPALLAQLQPGVDGLIIQAGQRRATFLPSVWQQLPDPESFLRHLKLKAGLPDQYGSEPLRAWRYRTECFGMDFNDCH